MMPDMSGERRVPTPEIFLDQLKESGPERSFEAFELVGKLVGDVVSDQSSSNNQLRVAFRHKVIEPLQKMVDQTGTVDPVIINWLKSEFETYFGTGEIVGGGESGQRKRVDGGLVGEAVRDIKEYTEDKFDRESRKMMSDLVKKSREYGKINGQVKFVPADELLDTLERVGNYVDNNTLIGRGESQVDLGVAVQDKLAEIQNALSQYIEEGRVEDIPSVYEKALELVRQFEEREVSSGWLPKWRENWERLQGCLLALQRDRRITEY